MILQNLIAGVSDCYKNVCITVYFIYFILAFTLDIARVVTDFYVVSINKNDFCFYIDFSLLTTFINIKKNLRTAKQKINQIN